MFRIRDLPIQRTIVAIIMIVSGAALFLASAELIVYDFVKSRRDIVANTAAAARLTVRSGIGKTHGVVARSRSNRQQSDTSTGA